MRAHRAFFTLFLALAAVVALVFAAEQPTDANHPGGDWHTIDIASRLEGGTISPGGGSIGDRHAASADGNLVVFQSQSNLLAADNNTNTQDVYVKNLVTEDLDLISVSTGGIVGDGHSTHASISRNGRFVVFESQAENLVGGDSNDEDDLFIRDRQAGTTLRLSLSSTGEQPFEIPGGFDPTVSDDGNVVAFESYQDDLVPNDPDFKDIFVRNISAGTLTRVTVSSTDEPANAHSEDAMISADGRYVGFQSRASNLVADDTNDGGDIFVHDLQTGVTELLTWAPNGDPSNGSSFGPWMSGNARFFTFYSTSSNLVGGDTDGLTDVFVFDRQSDTMQLITTGSNEGAFPSISDDGETLLYHTFDDDGSLFVRDRTSGTTQLVNVAMNGVSSNAFTSGGSISADGATVIFDSFSTSLVAGDTNSTGDVFYARKEASGPPPPPAFEVEMVSVTSQEAPSNGESFQPGISGDGRYVVFASEATNLEPNDIDAGDEDGDIFLRDRQDGTTTLISRDSSGTPGDQSSRTPDISRDGSTIAYTTGDDQIAGIDIPGFSAQVVVWDRESGATELVSVSSDGTPANFGGATNASLSADGRYVAFASDADNLVAVDNVNCINSCYDVFRHDRQSGVTEMASVSTIGIQGNTHSNGIVDISDDGSRVAFHSGSTNLVPGDNNNTCDNDFDNVPEENCIDVFVHDFDTGQTTRVSVTSNGAQANENSSQASISGDGRYVAFESYATNLTTDADSLTCEYDFEPEPDPCGAVFVKDLDTGTVTLASRALGGGAPNENATNPSISETGRYIAYQSIATDIVEGYDCLFQPAGSLGGCSDVYIYDRITQETKLGSIALDGGPGNDYSSLPAISSDGSVIAFHSRATDLVENDTVICTTFGTDNCGDIFAAELIPDGTPTPTPVRTPSPTPTAVPGSELWGDVDCDSSISSRDNQALQRFNLQQAPLSQTEPCPDIGSTVPITEPASGTPRIWGDNDCDSQVTTRDNQGTLRNVLQQNPLSQTEPCPDVGSLVAIGSGTVGPTATPTRTPTPTPTPTPTGNTGTATSTPTATPTRTPSPTPTLPSVTTAPTASPIVTASPSPTAGPTPTNECVDFPPGEIPIPDDDPTDPAILSVTSADSGTVSDVEICVNVDHTWVGELAIYLAHSVGSGDPKVVALLDGAPLANPPGGDASCSGNNLRVLFDDEASSFAKTNCNSGTPAISGTYRPDNSLSVFDGDPIAGEWQLWVYDLSGSGTGSVRGAFVYWNFD